MTHAIMPPKSNQGKKTGKKTSMQQNQVVVGKGKGATNIPSKEKEKGKKNHDTLSGKQEVDTHCAIDSHIAEVIAELRGIPQREANGEQLDARVNELSDELEAYVAKLEEEKERLLAVAFGPR